MTGRGGVLHLEKNLRVSPPTPTLPQFNADLEFFSAAKFRS